MASATMITAHTGFGAAPDNTWASWREAIASKADMAELDIRVTMKDEPVLLHDHSPLLERYGFAELNEDGIREGLGTVYRDHKLVSLADVLEEAKQYGMKLNLDIKNAASVNPTLELVRKLEAERLVYITGCTDNRIVDTTGMTVLLNVEKQDMQWLPDKLCELARSRGYQGLNLEEALLTPSLMQSAGEQGLFVSVYTVNDIPSMRRCLQLGVNSMTTMKVEQLRQMIYGGEVTGRE